MRRSAIVAIAGLVAILSGNAHVSGHVRAEDEEEALHGRGVAETGPNSFSQSQPGMAPQVSERKLISATLPNGADTLRETYGDWAVECRIVDNRRMCSIGQIKYDEQQRVVMFSIEIVYFENNNYKSIVQMPFGLSLSDGIRLQIDDDPLEHRGSFSTCLSNGCFVPLDFSDSSIAAMKEAKALRIRATAASGQNSSLTVSLKGFSAALERLKSLQ